MNNFDILNDWFKFSKYDSEQTRFQLGTIDCYSKDKNDKIQRIIDTYDSSGTIAVLYAKSVCMSFLKASKTSWYDALTDIAEFNRILAMYNEFNSSIVNNSEAKLISRIEEILTKVIPVKQLGEVDKDKMTQLLLESLSLVIDALDKCHYDKYIENNQPINPVSNINTNIQIFENIAQCLLTLEKAKDGMYLCYIDNDKSATGFFGFFIRSNGNIISINERLIELYPGQHKAHRNGQYLENKQFNLFPYDYIFKYDEYDYKGYAHSYTIEDDKLAFFNLGEEVYLPLIIAMILINIRLENSSFNFKQVYVDGLMTVNHKQLFGSDKDALMVINNSQLVAKNNTDINIEWTSEDILNNIPGTELTESADKEYYEYGYFHGYNHIFVDTYGEGFKFNPNIVFEQNKHLKLLTGDATEDARKDNTPNDMFVGTHEQMKLIAYYEARKQLSEYIHHKMEIEYDKFLGGPWSKLEKIRDWYRQQILQNLPHIQNIIYELECDINNFNKSERDINNFNENSSLVRFKNYEITKNYDHWGCTYFNYK